MTHTLLVGGPLAGRLVEWPAAVPRRTRFTDGEIVARDGVPLDRPEPVGLATYARIPQVGNLWRPLARWIR